MVTTKRIYESASQEDGYRVLVDRLWPRGISKDKARLDTWLKDLAPSDSLRKWYHHAPRKWEGFKTKYKAELKEKSTLLNELKVLETQYDKISLLYGARDESRNQAVVLKEVLDVMVQGKA